MFAHLCQFAGVVLVVDGPSSPTERIAQRAIGSFPGDRTLVLARNVGQHAATLAGIRLVGEGLVLTIDDDGQNDPREGLRLLQRLLEDDLDLVYGVSSGSEHARWRNYLSRQAKSVVARVTGPTVQQIASFRVLRSSPLLAAYPVVPPQPNLDAMLYWSTSRIGAMNVEGRNRSEGQSTYGIARLIRYGWNLVTTFSYVPLRIVTYMGLLSAAISIGLLLYFLLSYITDQNRVSGFTAIAAMVTAFAAIQFVALGVIGEYLSRVHVASVVQPPFVVQRVEEGGGAS